jgi:hypothetical protein
MGEESSMAKVTTIAAGLIGAVALSIGLGATAFGAVNSPHDDVFRCGITWIPPMDGQPSVWVAHNCDKTVDTLDQLLLDGSHKNVCIQPDQQLFYPDTVIRGMEFSVIGSCTPTR